MGREAQRRRRQDILYALDRERRTEIAAPKTFGFGRTAIEQSLAKAIDGTVSLDFLPTGLTCTIRAPLTERLGMANALQIIRLS